MSDEMMKELEQIMLEKHEPLSMDGISREDLLDGMSEEDAAYERIVVSSLVRSF